MSLKLITDFYRNSKVDIYAEWKEAKSPEPSYSQTHNQSKNQSIGQSRGRQTVRRLKCMVLRVETARKVMERRNLDNICEKQWLQL